MDYHQTDLAYSLRLLFEKRLGGTCLRPIGMEWWENKLWAIYDNPDTAEQYLGMRQGYQPKDGTLPLNNITDDFVGIYVCEDKHNNTWNKAITLERFKEEKIDIVIASIPAHIKPFKELARMKNAKFIFQQGNMFTEVLTNLHEIPNLLSSTIEFPVPPTCNAVFYHQEFDLDIFKPSSLPPEKQITSFINVYHENKGFDDYMMLKSMMPDYDFKSYGGQCQDGSVGTTAEIASIMQKSAYGFHVKRMGDGFGHILYNWFACGKPIITRISDYKGKLGEELLTDMETCIDLDTHSLNDIPNILQNIFPEQYKWMCQQTYNRFKEKVNFEKEKLLLDKWLNNLI